MRNEQVEDPKTPVQESRTSQTVLEPQAVAQTPKVPKPENDFDKKLSELDQTVVESKRQEAKFLLGTAYVSMKAFRAEYQRYSTDLKAILFEPDQSSMNYKVGFLDPYYPPEPISDHNFQEDAQRKDTDAFIGQNVGETNARYSYSSSTENLNLMDYRHLCKNGCTANENGFEIMIAYPIGDGRVDVWVINQDKELVLVKDGLSGTTQK